jgi:hypothetical protein
MVGWFMVFNATFNNISVISWRSVLLVKETGAPGENHQLCFMTVFVCSIVLLYLWVRISPRARCTTLCNQVCQWLAAGRWFSPGAPVSFTNKTDLHDITEILLKVALNTINQPTIYCVNKYNNTIEQTKTVIKHNFEEHSFLSLRKWLFSYKYILYALNEHVPRYWKWLIKQSIIK